MEQTHDLNRGDVTTETAVAQVTHAEMNTAFEIGTAAPLADTVPWLARYHGSWWVVYEHGWLRITDTLAAADIEATAARLTAPATADREEEPWPPAR